MNRHFLGIAVGHLSCRSSESGSGRAMVNQSG
jgi:hypothetical protein